MARGPLRHAGSFGIAVRKLIAWTSGAESAIATSPTITAGAGAPSSTEPQGSLYLRTNGTSASTLYVNTDGATTWAAQADLAAATLASTANGQGASLVGVEDASSYFAGATVEAVLTELGKYVPLALTDPGDAAAIPVTRSASIAITTGAGGETNTLAIPSFIGQVLVLSHDVDGGGNRVVTVTGGVNLTGNNTITFASAGESRVLRAAQVAGALVWRDVGGDAALSTV